MAELIAPLTTEPQRKYIFASSAKSVGEFKKHHPSNLLINSVDGTLSKPGDLQIRVKYILCFVNDPDPDSDCDSDTGSYDNKPRFNGDTTSLSLAKAAFSRRGLLHEGLTRMEYQGATVILRSSSVSKRPSGPAETIWIAF